MATDSRSTVVAVFPDREGAHAAIRTLHKAGYHRTWLGITETVDADSFGGAGGSIGSGRERVHAEPHGLAHWFHRERDQTLYDALLEHGVEEADARAIDGSIVEGSAVITIADVPDPDRVAELVRSAGGSIAGSIVERDRVSEQRVPTPTIVPPPHHDAFSRHRRTLGPGPY